MCKAPGSGPQAPGLQPGRFDSPKVTMAIHTPSYFPGKRVGVSQLPRIWVAVIGPLVSVSIRIFNFAYSRVNT